jgi:hypothetical protein
MSERQTPSSNVKILNAAIIEAQNIYAAGNKVYIINVHLYIMYFFCVWLK